MKDIKLILPVRIAPDIEPHLQNIPLNISVVHLDTDGTPDGDISDADAMIRWWTPKDLLRRILSEAPALRWIHTPSAGIDGFVIPELLERPITLTNAAGAHAIPIAEFVLMYMLSHVKRTQEMFALTPENAWEQGRHLHLSELYGKTLLILGLGGIGQEIVQRASPFGMRVFGSRRRPQPVEGVEQVVGEDGWRELLPEADYVVIATPLTESTRGMVDVAAFARMKPEAYLINIARGEIIDTQALLDALHEGRIAGAALDALPEEPLSPTHPLWQAPNVW
ncbi:MAG: D-2-hydroxyacid dehydrogenase, partial [Chloroflexota bacterium]